MLAADLDTALTLPRGDEWTSHPARAYTNDQLPWHAPLAIPDGTELRRGLLPSARVLRRLATFAAAAAVASALAPAASLASPAKRDRCASRTSANAAQGQLASVLARERRCASLRARRNGQHAPAKSHHHAGHRGGDPITHRIDPSGGASPAPPIARSAPSVPPAASPADPEPTGTTTGAPSVGTTSSSTLPSSVAQLSQLSTLLAYGDQPPAFLLPIYQAAGKRYHVPWRVLAAINSIETNYGRNLNVSSAGAIGWMQFMPATWLEYGVAADGRGQPNPYDPRDAIFAAARYLEANGARRDIRGAVYAYNHATWYVDEVMNKARGIIDRRTWLRHGKGYSLPLQPRYVRQLGRTDDGVDIETAPDGAIVYSITSGVVTAIASDLSGFGPNYPVTRVSTGPLAGRFIYYGHVAASIVRLGERVKAGEPIAVIGHTGDAASLGHGHIEIGFSTAGGDPLNHHGAAAWTASGAAMRRVLVSLSSLYGIRNS